MNEPLEKITQEEINELMKGLGFHRIPSKNRWKLKIIDTLIVPDQSLTHFTGDRQGLCDYMNNVLHNKISSYKSLIRRKRMLLAFFA